MTERRTRVAAVGLALCLALSVGTARGQVNEQLPDRLLDGPGRRRRDRPGDVLRALLRHGAARRERLLLVERRSVFAAGQPASPLAAAGQLDSTTVTGLTQGTTYYFVIVARDEAANLSQYSNVATGATQSCGAPRRPCRQGGRTTLPASWFRGSPLRPRGALDLPRRRFDAVLDAGPIARSVLVAGRDPSVAPGTIVPIPRRPGRPRHRGGDVRGARHRAGDRDDDGAGGSPGRGGRGIDPRLSHPATDRVQVELDVTATGPTAVRPASTTQLKGQRLATVAEGAFPPGRSVVTWDRHGRAGLRLAPATTSCSEPGNTRVRERLVLLP